MLIAVDHGNYSIKTPNFSFVAGLAEHTVRPITDDYLEYDGRFWTLTETRLHYMRDKTQDNRYFVLTLFAIIKELEKASALSPSLRQHRTIRLRHLLENLCSDFVTFS